ncbi:MAG: glycosyltransferase family 2 protein [Cyanobacteria bacterium P01_D01_bin.128]
MADLYKSSLSETDSLEDEYLYGGYGGRRRKAALTLIFLWLGTLILHLVSWGQTLVLALTALMSVHAGRILTRRPGAASASLQRIHWDGEPADGDFIYPYISLLVSAKNEEAVIGALVKRLCSLDYPSDRYDLWVINDNSSDDTGAVLEGLVGQHPQLNVVHRGAEATGGKSGALNLVWPQTKGDIIAVFDADAQVSADLLRQVVPLFKRSRTGAVQVRKAIANAAANFWTRGQRAEMALDSFFQQQRIAIGGIGELRGNGQFVRRPALAACGGWNEETITDDLDLTLRLHISGWNIDFLAFPAVREEGVTQAVALWHQRNRWAEGGYQRYLDYWRPIVRNRLGLEKTLDLVMFWMTQYMLPIVAVPDLAIAIARHRTPVFAPVTTLTVSLSVVGMYVGLRRVQKASPLVTAIQTLRGTLYMLHWLLVIASTAARISVRPKRLKWIKTVHQGAPNDSGEEEMTIDLG